MTDLRIINNEKELDPVDDGTDALRELLAGSEEPHVPLTGTMVGLISGIAVWTTKDYGEVRGLLNRIYQEDPNHADTGFIELPVIERHGQTDPTMALLRIGQIESIIQVEQPE